MGMLAEYEPFDNHGCWPTGLQMLALEAGAPRSNRFAIEPSCWNAPELGLQHFGTGAGRMPAR